MLLVGGLGVVFGGTSLIIRTARRRHIARQSRRARSRLRPPRVHGAALGRETAQHRRRRVFVGARFLNPKARDLVEMDGRKMTRT